jgi:hypothetical protein
VRKPEHSIHIGTKVHLAGENEVDTAGHRLIRPDILVILQSNAVWNYRDLRPWRNGLQGRSILFRYGQHKLACGADHRLVTSEAPVLQKRIEGPVPRDGAVGIQPSRPPLQQVLSIMFIQDYRAAWQELAQKGHDKGHI